LIHKGFTGILEESYHLELKGTKTKIIKEDLWALKLLRKGSRLKNFSAINLGHSSGKRRMAQRMGPRKRIQTLIRDMCPPGFHNCSAKCASFPPSLALEWEERQ
jgi:hypothetical protein